MSCGVSYIVQIAERLREDFFDAHPYIRLALTDHEHHLPFSMATEYAEFAIDCSRWNTHGTIGSIEPVCHELGHIIDLPMPRALRNDEHTLTPPSTKAGEWRAIRTEMRVYAIAQVILEHYGFLPATPRIQTICDVVNTYGDYDISILPGFFRLGYDADACMTGFRSRVAWYRRRLTFAGVQAAWHRRARAASRRWKRDACVDSLSGRK